MKPVTLLWAVFLTIAAGALALAYSRIGLLGLGLVGPFLSLAWFILQRRLPSIQHIALVLFTAGAAMGFPLGASPLAMLTAIIAALSAWDLAHFRERLAGPAAVEPGLVWRHLTYLLVVDALGFLLGAAALQIRIDLSFLPAAAAAVLLFYALGRVFFRIKIEN